MFTKGEWRVDGEEIVSGYTPELNDITTVNIDNPQFEANARLIAAAPKLYEALKAVLTEYNMNTHIVKSPAITLAFKALAEVRGEALSLVEGK